MSTFPFAQNQKYLRVSKMLSQLKQLFKNKKGSLRATLRYMAMAGCILPAGRTVPRIALTGANPTRLFFFVNTKCFRVLLLS